MAFQYQPDAEACFLINEDTSSPTHRATRDISIFGPSSWLDNGDGAWASSWHKIQTGRYALNTPNSTNLLA
jgi:hypothetical protein